MRQRFHESRVQALLIPVGAAILGGFYLAFIALRAGDSMHFDVTPLSTAFALAAGLAIAAGVVVVICQEERQIGARFALAVGTLVFAILAMFSIGLLILPVALLLLGFAIRELLKRRSGRAVRAALAGAVIGVGAVAYLLVINQPAVAACQANGGGSTSSGCLFGSTAVSSGGFSTTGGDSGGYIDEGDRIAYFSCHDGKLSEFYRLPLPQGQWVVTTQPAATVGRAVTVVFRLRPFAGQQIFSATAGFDFSATCRTCAEPRPVVRGHADISGPPRTVPGASVMFAGPVTFPAAGSWFTSPYDAAIEVR